MPQTAVHKVVSFPRLTLGGETTVTVTESVSVSVPVILTSATAKSSPFAGPARLSTMQNVAEVSVGPEFQVALTCTHKHSKMALPWVPTAVPLTVHCILG